MSEEANRRIAKYLKTGANTLDLSGCGITSLKNLPRLQECTGLTSLDLRWNQIDKIEGLEKFSKLESLNLRNNQIGKIEGLENLSKLESLDLEYNQISDIPIRSIQNVLDGSLRKNRIRTFSYRDGDPFKKNCRNPSVTGAWMRFMLISTEQRESRLLHHPKEESLAGNGF